MIYFWPTLQLIAFGRVAQEILYTFNIEDKRSILLMPYILWNTDYIQQIKKKVSEIVLPTFTDTFSRLSIEPTKFEGIKNISLPFDVQRQLVGLTTAMHFELSDWYMDHSFIFYGDHFDLKKYLVWFSFGVIDRLKTAQRFILHGNLSLTQFLYLACKYYFENVVRAYCKRNTTEREINANKDSVEIEYELWQQINNINASLDWKKIPLRPGFFRKHCLGIRNYFSKLKSSEMRYQCISYAVLCEKVHRFDLYSCLSRINDDELHAIFTRLPKEKLYNVFKSFLHWPFQIMFLDVLYNYKQHINEYIFYELVNYIIYYKIGEGFQDYKYIKLFECFWNATPAEYKNQVRNNASLYVLVRYILENSDSFSIEEYRNIMEDFN